MATKHDDTDNINLNNRNIDKLEDEHINTSKKDVEYQQNQEDNINTPSK